MSILTNIPVVFIAFGQGDSIWEQLEPALNSYANGIAYINPQENVSDSWLKSEVGRIWKDFLAQGNNGADIIRVNYIIGTDEFGLDLPTLRVQLEHYILELYPAGALVDIYCLLDDTKLLDEGSSRKPIVKMLKAQQAAGANVYLMSNLTSQNVLATNESIANTMAMLTLFKDCAPDFYVTGADASRYNELYFLDNCYSRNQGQFLTASSLNVNVPQDGLKALLMAELLSLGKEAPFIKDKPPMRESAFQETSIEQKPQISMEYLMGMAIPEVDGSLKLTRGQWLSRLFGSRLQNLVDANHTEQSQSPLSRIINDEENLYDLLRYTSSDGIYTAYTDAALAKGEKELQMAEAELRAWMDSSLDLTKGSPEAEKRRLSPLVTQDIWPYIIASGFLNRQYKICALRNKITVYEARRDAIAAANAELCRYQSRANRIIDKFLKDAAIMDEAFAPFSPCASDYFRKLFAEYAAQNRDELAEIAAKLTKAIIDDKQQDHINGLASYINDSVLTSSIFSRPIMETMHELVTESGRGNIATALGEWVFNHRQWNIKLKSGYKNLHTEINIYMPAQGAADVKEKYEERGLGRMNLFADASADRVAVLYHAGAFSLDDLYYAGLYDSQADTIGER
ncbi:MAG: hypothetical protein FWC78_03775 [Defluviitaleaceae bacterium]|nr:hypothetical protein [Defluviitaleaceae bacterium]